MTANELWDMYTCESKINHAEYEAWQFGDEPPKENAYSVILNSKDEAVCIIRTTKVSIVPFCNVSGEHAYKEGEGNRTLEYWKSVHEKFFTNELSELGMEFTDRAEVVCEEFEVVYR